MRKFILLLFFLLSSHLGFSQNLRVTLDSLFTHHQDKSPQATFDFVTLSLNFYAQFVHGYIYYLKYGKYRPPAVPERKHLKNLRKAYSSTRNHIINFSDSLSNYITSKDTSIAKCTYINSELGKSFISMRKVFKVLLKYKYDTLTTSEHKKLALCLPKKSTIKKMLIVTKGYRNKLNGRNIDTLAIKHFLTTNKKMWCAWDKIFRITLHI